VESGKRRAQKGRRDVDAERSAELRDSEEYRSTVAALREALGEMENGRTLSVEEAFREIRRRHGIPDAAQPP
jgi:hypothetical protein